VVQVHPPDFFIFEGVVWRKIVVVHANGTHWKKVFAVMVTANIVQISDAWMTVVNVGRTLKMTKQEAKKMQKELSDYKKVFSKLEERCSPEALEYWHRHLWYGLTIQSNTEAAAPKEGEPPKPPFKLADWLIGRESKDGIRLYGKNDLKQIALHLFIYCEDE
jgi:hypothetical protein